MEPETRSKQSDRSRWRTRLDACASILMILAAASVLWMTWIGPATTRSRKRTPVPRQPVSIEGAAVLGNRAARVAIIEYSDFQCPYCRVFARDILPQIKDAYVNPGKALLAFRHLPLVGIHPSAMKAAEGVECAGRQGKFWEMHERLFATGRRLDVTDLVASSDALGLDSADFFSCLDGRMMAKIQADIVNARDLHISTTPTFLIGRFLPDGRVTVTDTITGARPLADFRAVLDKLTQQVAASAW